MKIKGNVDILISEDIINMTRKYGNNKIDMIIVMSNKNSVEGNTEVGTKTFQIDITNMSAECNLVTQAYEFELINIIGQHTVLVVIKNKKAGIYKHYRRNYDLSNIEEVYLTKDPHLDIGTFTIHLGDPKEM